MKKLINILQEVIIKSIYPIIKPSSNYGGFITMDGYTFEYEVRIRNPKKSYVHVDLMSDYKLYLKVGGPETGDEYYPVKESKIACEYYIKYFKSAFTEASIELDDYDCSFISIPFKQFKEKMPSTVTVENNKFTYKGNSLLLQKMTPREREEYTKKYIEFIDKQHPHMNYANLPVEEAIKYTQLSKDYDVYFILDEKGNHMKNIYQPLHMDAYFGIRKKGENFEKIKLDLINYFNVYFPTNSK